MSEFKTYKDESRKNWGIDAVSKPDRDQLKLGCLQRIADATEAMAKNFLELQASEKHYRECYHRAIARERMLERRVAGLKGVITKMKRRSKNV